MNEVSGEKQASQVDRIKKYQWPKGKSGNPKGRPISPTTRIKEMFRENPDDFDEWLGEYIADKQNRKHVVEMIDGKPNQKGELEVTMPKPLLHAILNNDSDNEDNEA